MVGRPPLEPPTALAVALRARREKQGQTQREAAPLIGIDRATLARMERGTHAPSVDTALALARWLGWPLESVLEAARTPAASE